MKTTNKQTQSESIKRVANLFTTEGKSIGAVIRNFIEICPLDEFARYMLNNIVGYDRLTDNGKQYNAHEVCNVNEVKKALIKHARYISAEGQILRKQDGILQPAKNYGFWLIRDAFYVSIGQAKQETAKALEPGEAEALQKEIEAKQEAKQAKREADKKMREAAPSLKELLEKICNSEGALQQDAIKEARAFLKTL